MERTLILDTNNKVNQKVSVVGYVSTIRDHGKLVFIDLVDRSGSIQVVGDSKLGKLKPQDIVQIKGIVGLRPEKLVNEKLPTGKIELKVERFEVIEKSEELPLDMSASDLTVSLPTLFDYRALTLRHPKIKAIFKVQETIIESFRQTLKKMGFAEFQAPIIVPVTAEGGAEVFQVKYFNYQAYLAQSPQLYKQILLGAFERVFTVTHAFRAEPSVTTRHLTEYISLDAEMSFINSWEDLMDIVEYVIKNIITDVSKNCSFELDLYQAAAPKMPGKFPQIKLKEAQEIIYKRTKRDNRSQPDLSPSDEEEICNWAKEEKDSDFVFVTHYPVKKRPFYTFADPDDPKHTLSFDLLGKGLEWVTGGQRINNYDQLLKNLKKWRNDPVNFELYLQAFKYGIPPEGGFALGAERMTAKILGLSNIREASLFPRDMERIDHRLSSIQGKDGKGKKNK